MDKDKYVFKYRLCCWV